MIVLGIDPALTVTGYGVIRAEGRSVQLVEAGVIRTSSEKPVARRLETIYRAVSRLIDDTKPEVMVLEKVYSHHAHPLTAFHLGQARGVICLACSLKGLAFAEYAATKVKKAMVGNGRASKLQVQRMVADTFKVAAPKYADVTDALALALTHSYLVRP